MPGAAGADRRDEFSPSQPTRAARAGFLAACLRMFLGVCGSVERGRTDRAQRLYEAALSQGHV
jgi:hypothetical protein